MSPVKLHKNYKLKKFVIIVHTYSKVVNSVVHNVHICLIIFDYFKLKYSK